MALRHTLAHSSPLQMKTNGNCGSHWHPIDVDSVKTHSWTTSSSSSSSLTFDFFTRCFLIGDFFSVGSSSPALSPESSSRERLLGLVLLGDSSGAAFQSVSVFRHSVQEVGNRRRVLTCFVVFIIGSARTTTTSCAIELLLDRMPGGFGAVGVLEAPKFSELVVVNLGRCKRFTTSVSFYCVGRPQVRKLYSRRSRHL